jgi:hypothetical protein
MAAVVVSLGELVRCTSFGDKKACPTDASCGAMRVCGEILTTHHVNRDDVFSASVVR